MRTRSSSRQVKCSAHAVALVRFEEALHSIRPAVQVAISVEMHAVDGRVRQQDSRPAALFSGHDALEVDDHQLAARHRVCRVTEGEHCRHMLWIDAALARFIIN